ncbi:STAS domain-containing protein [Ramlibacter tataouinensis]|uniref:STAS domain-containing protein n=1 Tax=Ramlibacter tataouinensis TaxID=94132 RepID=UPI0022F3987D|nr:STAS domain-containing protein [Ramlibacter tataouinensis]WBY00765.1 STAS domain-containing protein [Ramlibacter tataouinensis]
MPKDENTGLFSKVVKFVRNPGANWAEGAPDSEQESSYSRQMLKEMIERKRRNDFVRKREFDMLRKMRRSEVMAGQDPAGRPSFFQSSMPSKPDDRASTLKKIDEIEAQMSMQWWKTKHGEPARSTQSTPFPGAGMPSDPAPRALAGGTVQGALPAAGAAAARPAAASGAPAPIGGPAPSGAYVRTEPQPLAPAAEPQVATAPTPMLESVDPSGWRKSAAEAEAQKAAGPPSLGGMRPALYHGPESNGASGFSASKVFAIDVEEFAHDPELEEASIRFANGDDAGAEAGLMEVLAPGGPRIDHDETWLALFDLYRATGQQERFEGAAIDFAGRFGRSAPQWISLPEAVGQMGSAAAAPAAGGAIADWTCPSSLGTQTLAALNAALGRAAQPWRLSWSKLATIEEAAVEGLAKLFTQWASQAVQIRFIGAEHLERILRDATPSGDKGVEPGWWKLRMEVLRVMHRPDEFELVALDYCVTYEVSPPSWESARCDYKPLQADGSAVASNTIVGDAFRDSIASGFTGFGESMGAPLSSQMASVASVELAGQILGDAKEAIELLDSRLAGADFMVISCARLIRIDFTAAGTLLNWVSARQVEGRQVQFIDVHRLVAAFFNVIGIGEYARVSARRD